MTADYKLIPLTQGKFAKVSLEDYYELAKFGWHVSNGYAKRWTTGHKRQKIAMHRLIMNPSQGMEVDHINGDTLDNRRANLRVATKTENRRNKKMYSNSTSPYKGICGDFRSRRKKVYCARLVISGKQTNLGFWPTPEQAAEAYDMAARYYYGEFARPNFEGTRAEPLEVIREMARGLVE